MTSEKKIELAIERDYKVVKANEIIQKARFDLGILEQKTFCYAVSKIKPDDTVNTEYVFSINEYCEVCGIKKNSGKTNADIKETLQKLRNKSFWLTDENGDDVLIGWLSKARIMPRSGKVKIKFDEDMQKYLTGLYSNYTQYSLLCVLPMRSAYSIRLYELLKSYSGLHKKDFEVEELKKQLCAPYERFPDLRRKAIEVAIKEINQYTDIEVKWEPVLKGRKVVKLHFEIRKRDRLGTFENMTRGTEILDGQYKLKL